jgi:twitching motility two-component system response regulator PilG
MGKKILIVEDEKSILKLESLLLTARGYQVQGVEEGSAAFQAVKKFRPDLILLDVMLPGLDGFEICRLLKGDRETRDIPVVMLTARSSSLDMARGAEAGACHYITKPFESSTIVETVQNCLAGAA